jgi:hypothetical protein
LSVVGGEARVRGSHGIPKEVLKIGYFKRDNIKVIGGIPDLVFAE